MPERIATATLTKVDTETLELDDAYPGTYGFYVRLSRDPGAEWANEFESAYDAARRPGKPPIVFRGDTLCVFYLARYADELPDFLKFLDQVVRDTNMSVDKRNSVLPDEEKEKLRFREQLQEAARQFGATRP